MVDSHTLQSLDVIAVIVAVSYFAHRLSVYGADKMDRAMLRAVSLLAALVLPAALFSNLGAGFEAFVYVLSGAFLVAMLTGGIPGLRIQIPNDHARNRLLAEGAVVFVLVLALQWAARRYA